MNRFEIHLSFWRKQQKINKNRRGFIEELYAKNKDTVLVRWYYDKSVCIASNVWGKGNTDVAKR